MLTLRLEKEFVAHSPLDNEKNDGDTLKKN